MTTVDQLHRTMKLELDQGRAGTVEEAEALTATYVLQIAVGTDIAASPTRQAMLMTAINAGARAFRGGVRIHGDLNWTITTGWGAGARAADIVTSLGGVAGDSLDAAHPTLTIGRCARVVPGAIVLHLTWNGWAGGAVTSAESRLDESAEFTVAGVLAGALGVSEAFQHQRGSLLAGRRTVGLSLWDPNAEWASDAAAGPELRFLPTRLWLLGLGHLGQAYAWALGYLPYGDRRQVEFTLQDYDHVVEANRSTGMLVANSTPNGVRKTRLVAGALERLGFHTRLIERAFDYTTKPSRDEPIWALAGFDSPAPRCHLDNFELAVDLGLGASQDDYLGIHLHTFPAAGSPADIFVAAADDDTTGRSVEASPHSPWATAAAEDACGVVQLEGASVGAAFVGATAAAFGLAEVLRALAGGPPIAIASLTLAAPQHAEFVLGNVTATGNPGFQSVRQSESHRLQ